MTPADGQVALATGEVVSTASQAWRDECKTRHDHVQTLLRMRGVHMRHARQQYLADVFAREGEESARRLKQALLHAWGVLDASPTGGAG
jgi:hypothetical protein